MILIENNITQIDDRYTYIKYLLKLQLFLFNDVHFLRFYELYIVKTLESVV